MSISTSTARRTRHGGTLPSTPAVGDVYTKTGSAAGFYECHSAGVWSGPLDSTSDTGDFTGPASSTDNALVRYDGAGGKTGQNSVVLVGDTGNVTGLGTLNTNTLPTGPDTLVGRATTDTLTNKTLTSPAITTPTGIVKGDVGLGSVDNTSDAGKPVSTAQQTALDLKANDADVVHDTGDETIAGVKTFTSDPLIPDEAYGVGWNGSLEPPTKNAVYDKVETLGGAAYLKYVALLTQTGTDAPVATVLENTLGGTVVWTRSGVGIYVGTLASAFTADKTYLNWAVVTVDVTGLSGGTSWFQAARTSANVITLEFALAGEYSDWSGTIGPVSLTVHVYP